MTSFYPTTQAAQSSVRESAFKPKVKPKGTSVSLGKREVEASPNSNSKALQEVFSKIADPLKREEVRAPRPPTPAELDDEITQAKSIQDLFKTFKEQEKHLDEEHYAKILRQLSQKKIDRSEKSSVQQIVKRAQVRIPDFSSAQAISAANAVAKLKLKNTTFFEKIGEGFATKKTWKLSKLDESHLTQLAASFCTEGAGSVELFEKLEKEIRKRGLKKFNQQEIAQIAHAFAKSGNGTDIFFKKLAKVTRVKIDAFDEQSLCKLAWAFSIRGNFRKKTFKKLITKIEARESRLNSLDLNQLAQVQLHLKYEAPKLNKLLQTGTLAEKLEALRKSKTDENSTISSFHEEVFSTLKRVWPEITEEEVFKEDSFEINVEGLLVDIVIPEYKVAIEVNGDTHYKGTSQDLDGISTAKLRLLRKLGYATVEVPFFIWRKLNREEKENFLKRQILSALKSRSIENYTKTKTEN